MRFLTADIDDAPLGAYPLPLSPPRGTSPFRTCSWQACMNLATTGTRCAEHSTAQSDDRRRQAAERAKPYSTTDWRAIRARIKKRDPNCKICHDHRSAVADHWPLERKHLVAMGVTDPDADYRLRGVCMRCHNNRSGGTR